MTTFCFRFSEWDKRYSILRMFTVLFNLVTDWDCESVSPWNAVAMTRCKKVNNGTNVCEPTVINMLHQIYQGHNILKSAQCWSQSLYCYGSTNRLSRYNSHKADTRTAIWPIMLSYLLLYGARHWTGMEWNDIDRVGAPGSREPSQGMSEKST